MDELLMSLSCYGSPHLVKSIYKNFSIKAALENRKKIFDDSIDNNNIETMLTYDQKTYLVDLLIRQDKMSMAHSIENRVPFLDHRMVELAKRIPTCFKIKNSLLPFHHNTILNNKYILKKMASAHFNKEFVYRKKSGFGLPLHEFFSTIKFQELWEQYRNNFKKNNIFDLKAVDNLYSNALRGDYPSLKLFWIILSFQVWHSVFIDRSGSLS